MQARGLMASALLRSARPDLSVKRPHKSGPSIEWRATPLPLNANGKILKRLLYEPH